METPVGIGQQPGEIVEPLRIFEANELPAKRETPAPTLTHEIRFGV